MEELAIKIRICGREYPMKVSAIDEACVRTAGKMINHQVRAYRDKFGIQDTQDLLAMVAFDCLVDNLKLKDNVIQEENKFANNIEHLIQLINKSI